MEVYNVITKRTLSCMSILILAVDNLLHFGLCIPTGVNLQCTSSSYFCIANRKISKTGDVFTVDTSSSCEACVLRVNTTRPNKLSLDIKPLSSSWSQSHHFYIVYDGVTTGFASNPGTCSLTFPTNDFEVHFKMDVTFTIQALTQTSPCSDTNATICTNCNGLLKFDDVAEIKFVEQNTFFDSLYLHPQIYHWFAEREVRGVLPRCPFFCMCHLHYQQLIAHCSDTTRSTLLHHTDIVFNIIFDFPFPLNVLDASDRQLETIDVRAFNGMKYVNRLNLNNNLLTHIESGTFGWYQLLMLEIANNKLTELQSNIFSSLSFLFFLDLHGNQLKSLHPKLFQSQRLYITALELSRNNLAELLPETFSSLHDLRVLILDDNNITAIQPRTFQDLEEVWWLYLDNNKLTTIEPETFYGCDRLFRIHLSGNQLTELNPDMFKGAEVMKELLVSRNNITFLQPDAFRITPDLLLLSIDNNQLGELDLQPFTSLKALLALNISGNRLKSIKHGISEESRLIFSNNTNVTSVFPKLKLLELMNNEIQVIDENVFKEMPIIQAIQLRGNPLKWVDENTFRPLDRNDTYILVDEPATCCSIDKAQCKAQNQREPYLTCLRLLPYPSVRVFMWIFGLFAFVGNLSVLLWRCRRQGRENIIQVLLIENLAASDLLMGVYMLIIASADAYYQQYFPSESDEWRNGPLCKLAGVLSVISSEASVFFITLISIDRFLAIKYPRGKHRLTKKSARITVICLWSLALLLSIVPTSVGGKNPDFYDSSEVCIGLPFVRAPIYLNKTVIALEFDFEGYDSISSVKYGVYKEDYTYPETGNKPGLYFSIVLFLGVNLLCFFIVAVSYVAIFVIVKQTTRNAFKSRRDQEITLAIRMGAIVITDFMCWVPIVVIGILVQSVTMTVSPVVYVYIVVFILPINSAVNPYIYTIAILISDYRTRTRAKIERNKKVKTKASVPSKNSKNKT